MKTFQEFLDEHCGCEKKAVVQLEHELKKLKNTSYESINRLMHNIMKEHNITAKQLHDAFVKKHNKTPDDWIDGLNEDVDEYEREKRESEKRHAAEKNLEARRSAAKTNPIAVSKRFTKSKVSAQQDVRDTSQEKLDAYREKVKHLKSLNRMTITRK